MTARCEPAPAHYRVRVLMRKLLLWVQVADGLRTINKPRALLLSASVPGQRPHVFVLAARVAHRRPLTLSGQSLGAHEQEEGKQVPHRPRHLVRSRY